MLNKLKELQKNSHSPYSNFRVAAIVKDVEGIEWYGVNVENASFGATNCAERSAIFTAVSNGSKKLKEIHIIADLKNKPISPCGICRQVMAEFMEKDSMIFMYAQDGSVKKMNLQELLPYSFEEEDLN